MVITRPLAGNNKAKASNSTLVPLLPPEIIEWEILSRLLVQSLLRYKSVCKSWNLLISRNHNFIKSQLVLNPNKDSLILEQRVYPGINYVDSYIVGCIDGLVCFFRWPDDDLKLVEIKIWNPALYRCLVLPSHHLEKDIKRYDVLLGFGFDSVAHDFKVMYGTKVIEKQPLAVDVYSCKSACWKKIASSNILCNGEMLTQTQPIIVNGCPFWLIQKSQDAKISLAVIWFDVGCEVFRLLPSFGSIDHSVSRVCELMN
ncbi:F-box/kelch-repeat protein At3g23880-like [Apium graveolens]|uniref:F-box/kelch-repeat protein At3g23880-like n=1 Tax=Apium graveolens TaxID=4045 RepID=UPI003D7AD1FC